MSEIHPIYSFEDYRNYLDQTLQDPRYGRGSRKKLAEHLNCQSSFISQVLNGKNEFSLEHAYSANQFLGHTKDESHYFLNMVQLARAGTVDLGNYFRSVLEDLRNNKLQVHEVLQGRTLSEAETLSYCGNWLCISIHMLTAIPRFQKIESLKEKLQVGDSDFNEALEFLKNTGLVVQKGEHLETGDGKIHMKKSSPYAQVASIMTRQKVIDKLKIKDPHSLNYTGNITIPKEAFQKIKKSILELIHEIDEHVDSGESEAFCTIIIDLIEH